MSVWGRLTTTVSGSVGYVGIPITFSVWGYLTASEYVGVEASYSLDYEGGGAWTSASFSFTTVLTLTVYSNDFGKTLTVGADAFVGASTPTSTTLLILVEASTSSTTTATTTTTTTATTTTSSTSPTTSSPSSTSSSATFWARIEEVRAIETITVPPEAVSAVIPITVYVTGYAPNAVDIAVYASGSNDWEEDDLGVYGPNEAISAAATLYYTIHTFNSPDTVTIELDTDTYFSYTAVVITLEAVKQTPTTTTTVTSTTTTTTTTATTTQTTTTTQRPTIRIVGGGVTPNYGAPGSNAYVFKAVVTLTNLGGVGANVVVSVYAEGGPGAGEQVYVGAGSEVTVTLYLNHNFGEYGPRQFNVYAEAIISNNVVAGPQNIGAYTIPYSSIRPGSITSITHNVEEAGDEFGTADLDTWNQLFTAIYTEPWWTGAFYVDVYSLTEVITAVYDTFAGWYWSTETRSSYLYDYEPAFDQTFGVYLEYTVYPAVYGIPPYSTWGFIWSTVYLAENMGHGLSYTGVEEYPTPVRFMMGGAPPLTWTGDVWLTVIQVVYLGTTVKTYDGYGGWVFYEWTPPSTLPP